MSTPVTFTIDVGPFVQVITPVVEAGLGIAGTAMMGYLAKKFHLQVSAQQAAAWDSSLEKALSYGGMQVQDMIKSHGYDHVEVQNALVAQALTYMVQKFPQEIKGAGYKPDLNDSENALKIREALLRALPSAMSKFASSPATPAVKS